MIWYPWYPRAAAFLAKSRTESIITWTQHYNHYRMPEGPTPLSPQYSFQIWLRNWFPVHYIYPVVFNWLGYKPSKWCNLIPQASAEVSSLSLDDQKMFLDIYDSVGPKIKNFWSIYSASHRWKVDCCGTRSSEQPGQPLDRINHFEVMQRQKGWKFMAIKTPAFLSCFGAFDTSSGSSSGP